MKKIILVIAMLILASLTMTFLLKKFSQSNFSIDVRNRSRCQHEKLGRAASFSGIIIKKFFDTENHAHKTIRFENNNDIKESTLFVTDLSGAYDFIMEGDSIIKDKGELRVRIYRDSLLKEFHIDYGCIH